jgi:anti-anti-sigma regulatory factor
LIGAQRRAKEVDGDVRLVVKEGQILRLLRITGLLKVFNVYPTLTAALAGGDQVGDL